MVNGAQEGSGGEPGFCRWFAEEDFCGDAEAVNELAHHGDAEAPLAGEYLGNFRGGAEERNEILVFQPLLFHPEADGRDGTGNA